MSGDKKPKIATEPVGQQLRRAREQLDLDVSAIADQQHLRTSVIEAIEKADYSKIDTELFLKGYVRAYAQQVGLNADAMVRYLDIELEPLREERERQHEADPLVDIERRKRRKRRMARAIVVLLVLVAIGFGVSAWLAGGERRIPGFGSDVSGESGNVDPSAVNEPNSGEQTPEIDSGGSEEIEPELATVEVETAAEVELVTSPVMNAPVAETSEETSSPSVAEEAEGTAQDVEPPGAEAPEVVRTEPLVNDPQPTAAEPMAGGAAAGEQPEIRQATLRMSFSGDCWVQITDAEGNRLASALRTEGESLEVEGVAPLGVVVGAMDAVDSLEFQGEPVKLDSFRVVNNRAEFSLEL